MCRREQSSVVCLVFVPATFRGCSDDPSYVVSFFSRRRHQRLVQDQCAVHCAVVHDHVHAAHRRLAVLLPIVSHFNKPGACVVVYVSFCWKVNEAASI